MAINFILSNTFKAGFLRVASQIENALKSSPINKQVIIVPDRFTLSIERSIMEVLKLEGSMEIDVMSFTRLATKLQKADGKKLLSLEGAVMIMQKALQNCTDKLNWYKNSTLKAGFNKEIYAVLTQLRASSVTPELIEASLPKLSGKLKFKMQDIAIIYREFQNCLGGYFFDSLSKMENLSELIRESYVMQNCDVYITDFFNFTAVERKVIKELMCCANSVSIVLLHTNNTANNRLFNTQTYAKLLNTANVLNLKTNNVYVSEALKAPANEIEKNIYGYSGEGSSDNCPKLFVAKNIMTEVENLCREIKNQVMAGVRFRDIAIIASSIDEYAKVVPEIFTRYEIPFFIDEKYDLSQMAQVQFLLSALGCCMSEFDKSKVLSLVTNPMFKTELSPSSFFKYVKTYNVNGYKFKKPFKYSMENVDKAEAVRQRVVSICQLLTEKPKTQELPFSEFYQKVIDFLNVNNVYDKTEQLVLNLANLNYLKLSGATQRGTAKLVEILNEQFTIFNNTTDTFENYAEILIRAIENHKISTIPLFNDAVFIGETKESRYLSVQCLYIIGAREGAIPYLHDDNGILNDSENAQIAKCGLSVEPTKKTLNNENRLHTLQLLLKPKISLTISYAQNSPIGECLPSSIMRELARIFNIKIAEAQNFDDLNLPNAVRGEAFAKSVLTKANASHMLAGFIGQKQSEIFEAGELLPYDGLNLVCAGDEYGRFETCESLPSGAIQGLKTMSATRLQSYFECPYKHFAKYILGLKELREFKNIALERGNIVHRVMEWYLQENPNCELSESEIRKCVVRYIAKLKNKDEFKYCFNEVVGFENRIASQCVNIVVELQEMVKNSLFKPKFLETEIATTIDNVKFNGKVDRIDCNQNMAMIIDYKTGNVTDAGLKHIYYGLKIQLYLYALALKNDFDIVAMFYLPVTDNYTIDESPKLTYKGQVVKELETVLNLDTTINIQNVQSKYLPVSLAVKNNALEFKKGNTNLNVVTRSEFDELFSYISLLSKNAIGEIESGYIAKKPCKKPWGKVCDNCQYISLCKGKSMLREVNERVAIETFARGEK